MSRNIVVYNNITYDSLSDLCRQLGLNRAVISSRLHHGWSLDDAISKPIETNFKQCYDPIHKKYYKSAREMCKAHDINYATFKSRIDNGVSIEDALKTKNFRKLKIEYNGRTYNTLKDACDDVGINYGTVMDRIINGWDVKKALSTPANANTLISYKGVQYKSLRELCLKLDLDYGFINSRLQHGFSLEDAITKEKISHEKSITIQGVKYKSRKEAYSIFGVSEATITRRIKQGMSIEEAFLCERDPRVPLAMNILGKTYPSVSYLSKEIGVPIGTILRKVKIFDRELLLLNTKGDYVRLDFIGLDNKARYRVSWSSDYVTARQIIEYYRPDLLSKYDEYNPTGEYNPYRGGGKL